MSYCKHCGRSGKMAAPTAKEIQAEFDRTFLANPTLRDQFAMAALTGLISRGPLAHNLHIDHKEGRSEFVLNACSDAYWIADAMIAAR